jgi:hypothetical protein
MVIFEGLLLNSLDLSKSSPKTLKILGNCLYIENVDVWSGLNSVVVCCVGVIAAYVF